MRATNEVSIIGVGGTSSVVVRGPLTGDTLGLAQGGEPVGNWKSIRLAAGVTEWPLPRFTMSCTGRFDRRPIRRGLPVQLWDPCLVQRETHLLTELFPSTIPVEGCLQASDSTDRAQDVLDENSVIERGVHQQNRSQRRYRVV